MVSIQKLKHPFTAREQALLDLLPKDGSPVSSTQLVKRYYLDEVPLNGSKIVVGRMSLIMKKAERNAAGFIIKKTHRSGPHPVTYWLEAA